MALQKNEQDLLDAAYSIGFFDHVEAHMGASDESVVALILACQAAVIAGMLPDIVDMSKRNMYKARLEQIEARSMELANIGLT